VAVGSLTLGPFEVTSALTNHPIECHGLRLSAGGKTLAYSADTGASDALVELARDADVFLCEASWEDSPDNPPGVHLSGREAGEHAQRAGARLLLLTHIVAWADADRIQAEAASAYAGQIELAECGRTYQL
jgi:ribonuclease BN (tRNA processing enzyme)